MCFRKSQFFCTRFVLFSGQPLFRVMLQILLKSHRFIGNESYPLPSPSDLRAQAGLLSFWKLGGQSRRVETAVTLTQALINQPQK